MIDVKPQLSSLKDAGFGASKWISQVYAHESNGTTENIGPSLEKNEA